MDGWGVRPGVGGRKQHTTGSRRDHDGKPAGEGDTAEVLVILTAERGSDRLLEVVLQDGQTFELDLAMFKTMAAMPDNEAWLSYVQKELT